MLGKQTIKQLSSGIHAFAIETPMHLSHTIADEIADHLCAETIHLSYHKLSIDSVRKMGESFRERSNGRTFIISISSTIGIEAQNAFLKILEEPASGTKIILLLPNFSHLLPTVQSRVLFLERVSCTSDQSGPDTLSAKSFLGLGLSEKIKYTEKFLKKKEKDSDNEEYSNAAIINFCDELLVEIPANAKNAQKISDILLAKSLINMRGASAKMILEFLAIALYDA